MFVGLRFKALEGFWVLGLSPVQGLGFRGSAASAFGFSRHSDQEAYKLEAVGSTWS